MKVSLISVFFHPSNEDIQSFLNISKIFNYSYCFLNSKITNSQKEAIKKNSYILGNCKNLGLSKAYNFQFKEVLKYPVDYVFIIDQDSRFEKEKLNSLFKKVNNLRNVQNNIGIYSLCPIIDTKKPKSKKNIEFSKKDFVINSGSLVNIKAWSDIGGYDEKLFIDAIDYDFCKRLKLKGWDILQSNNIYFEHSLGNRKKILWGLFNYSSYKEFRHSTIMQSRLYLYKKFKAKKLSINFFTNQFILICKIIKQYLIVIFFEQEKSKIIKSLNKLIKNYKY
tara:strand:+ start:386 stop:1222 length:837 start_codon:yes stop_codon:yes gene_type:complete